MKLGVWMIGIALLIVDQLVKFMAGRDGEVYLNSVGAFSVDILPQWALVVVSLGVLLGLVWWYGHVERQRWLRWGLVLVIAGGLSNLIDRFWYGGTVDVVRIFEAYVNLADIYVLVGAVVMLGAVFLENPHFAKASRSRQE